MLSPQEVRAEYESFIVSALQPGQVEIAEPIVAPTPARRLRDAVETIATICWWSREANEAGVDLGLSFFERYVRGRAAPLGSSNASLIVSCFGTFSPKFIRSVLDRANATITDEQILRARELGAMAALRAVTHGMDMTAVDGAASRLYWALERADGAGRPLFAALRSLPVPTDPYGKLWRAAELYREHRGDGNLAVSVSTGLDAVEMNVMTELWIGYPLGEYSSSRGFGPDRIAAAAESLRRRGWVDGETLTDEGRRAREKVERATDDTQGSLLESIAQDVPDITKALADIGRAVIVARYAPSDPRKRAAG